MRVLISAYACEPGAGSEPGAGWEWVIAAAKQHEIWLATRRNNRESIDAALRASQLPITPVYLEADRALRFKRGQRGIHAYYLLWQRELVKVARALHKDVRFDVAHHVTFAVDWMPSGLAGLPSVPLVWGPVGGASRMPWSLYPYLTGRSLATEAARDVVTRLMRRTVTRSTVHRARVIIVQNEDGLREFRHAPQVRLEPNVVMHKVANAVRVQAPRTEAVFVGRLVDWKGIRLAIEVWRRPELRGWTLHVYGGGAAEQDLRRLVNKFGLEKRVLLHGHRPRDEVRRAVAAARVFVFPSMHDSAPWAVGEALSEGVPVVCLDVGGPPTLVRLSGAFARGIVPLGPGIEGRLAAAVLDAANADRVPSPRFAAERLPSLVTSAYEAAVRA